MSTERYGTRRPITQIGAAVVGTGFIGVEAPRRLVSSRLPGVAGDRRSEPDYPTFADRHESMLVCEAVARRARDGTWARVGG